MNIIKRWENVILGRIPGSDGLITIVTTYVHIVGITRIIAVHIQLVILDDREASGFHTQHVDHELEPRDLALEAGDQTLLRKGGFLGFRKGP